MIKDFTLKKAADSDLAPIRMLYWKLLDSSEQYAHILQWKKDIYPADEDWKFYIDNNEMYVLCDHNDLIGAFVLTRSQSQDYRKIDWEIDAKDDEVSVVHLLVVDPDYQGRGIATAILDEIIRIAKTMGKKAVRLDAIITNKPAQKIYEKYGFIRRGQAQEYYESTGFTEFIFYEYILCY